MALLAFGLAAGLCPICCTEPQLAGSPAASMYQYGAGAGIGCDTSVLVPAATLSVGETPSAPGKRRWAALQGFPVQFPRPPARTPVLGSAHAQRSQHSTDVDMMPIAVSAGETLDDKRDPPPDKIRTKLALQNKRGRAYGVSDYLGT